MSDHITDSRSSMVAWTINDIVSRTPGGFDLRDVQGLNTMAADVHARNVGAGWWHDIRTGEDMRGKRNIGELLCLVHSEVDEAFDGLIGNLPDDKLTHRRMLEVELADVLIRDLDLAGSVDMNLGAAVMLVDVELLAGASFYQTQDDLNRLHRAVSRAMEGHRKKKQHADHPMYSVFEMGLAEIAVRVFHIARKLKLDLGGAYTEKLEFNKSRLDHKPENRLAAGGKEY